MRSIPFSPPDISQYEIDLVVEALKSGWITTGPKTKQFEREIAKYCGTTKAVCLNSATAAMELSLHVLGIGPGDEVITSAYTYSASAAVIHHVGAKIILVDTAPGSFEMDYDKMEQSITERTKAIIPVDIAGVMCDYDRIYEAVNRKKDTFVPKNQRQKAIGRVTVIADAAHSFGANRNGVISGKAADITCFSFHAVKNLTTAEGGAITWTFSFGMSDDEMYHEYMLLSLHGQSKDALAKMQKGSWEYDIVYPAYKCNMTDILSAVGLGQLSRYDEMLKKRFEIISVYSHKLDKRITQIEHIGSKHKSSGHLMLCNIDGYSVEQRNQLIKRMAEFGISTNVHYKPLPMFTAYKNLGFLIEDYPNAYKKYTNEITLPLHSLLSGDDVDYIIQTINTIITQEFINV